MYTLYIGISHSFRIFPWADLCWNLFVPKTWGACTTRLIICDEKCGSVEWDRHPWRCRWEWVWVLKSPCWPQTSVGFLEKETKKHQDTKAAALSDFYLKKNLPYLFSDTMMFPKHYWFLGKKRQLFLFLMVDKAFIDFIGSIEGSVFSNQGFTAFQSCRHGFIRFTAVHVPVTFLATASLCGQTLWMPWHKKTALNCISWLWFHDGWMHACTVDRLDIRWLKMNKSLGKNPWVD